MTRPSTADVDRLVRGAPQALSTVREPTTLTPPAARDAASSHR